MSLYTLPSLYRAVVINRPSKVCKSPYLADIKIMQRKKCVNGKIFVVYSKEIMAHSPSLGCGGLIKSSSIVYVSKLEGKGTKSKYRIHLSEYIDPPKKNLIVGTNPNLCNDIFENILKQGQILTQFNGYDIVREYKIGNSRIDFYLKKEDSKVLIEVKNVCLAYYEDIPIKEIKKKDYSNYIQDSKISIFPDCNRKHQKNPVSPRANKHVDELVEASKNGYKCYLAFIIQRSDCTSFSPSKLDMSYYNKLKDAHKSKSLEIFPIMVEWQGNNCVFKKIISLDKDFLK